MSLTPVNDRTYEGTTMPPVEDKLKGRAAVKGRDAQRQQTRQRVYAAALAEFKRTGMGGADGGEPVEDTATDPADRPSGQGFLPVALGEVVRLLTAMERRVGKTLFREMLGLHFSSRRPEVLPGSDKWTEYPVMTVVVEVVERARERGEVHPDASALPTAQLFMMGLCAMLIASHEYSRAARAEILDNFMPTVLRGISPR